MKDEMPKFAVNPDAPENEEVPPSGIRGFISGLWDKLFG